MESDIQGPNRNSPDDIPVAMSKRSRGTGEGLCQLSWIWRVRCKVPHAYTEDQACIEGNTLTTENDVDKCESLLLSDLILNTALLSDLKIEYAKTKARVAQWHKEILLIHEEM